MDFTKSKIVVCTDIYVVRRLQNLISSAVTLELYLSIFLMSKFSEILICWTSTCWLLIWKISVDFTEKRMLSNFSKFSVYVNMLPEIFSCPLHLWSVLITQMFELCSFLFMCETRFSTGHLRIDFVSFGLENNF